MLPIIMTKDAFGNGMITVYDPDRTFQYMTFSIHYSVKKREQCDTASIAKNQIEQWNSIFDFMTPYKRAYIKQPEHTLALLSWDVQNNDDNSPIEFKIFSNDTMYMLDLLLNTGHDGIISDPEVFF
ncbi:MAG: hypothetical protein HAW62_01875 [Endozoicomonadaceae bacterium]|nr:hypothetical protein [Endozoicomonadaceae bacterium]